MPCDVGQLRYKTNIFDQFLDMKQVNDNAFQNFHVLSKETASILRMEWEEAKS